MEKRFGGHGLKGCVGLYGEKWTPRIQILPGRDRRKNKNRKVTLRNIKAGKRGT